MLVGTKRLSPNFSRHATVGWNLMLSLNQYWRVKVTEMIKKLQCQLYKKMRELFLFSMEKRILRGAFYQYVQIPRWEEVKKAETDSA